MQMGFHFFLYERCYPGKRLVATGLQWLLLLVTSLALSGCQAVGAASVVSKVADFALQASGLKKDSGPQPKWIDLRLEASQQLNADASGRPLSVVAKIYKLRDPNSFLQAPFEAFGNDSKEKQAFGTDVLEVRELLLIPGQKYDAKEKMTPESAYLGVVALFRSPGPSPWRLTIAQADLEKKGAAIAVDRCSLRVIDPSAETDKTIRQSTRCR